ncbi:MAG: hypothetical protein RBS31_00610 [Candidatus Syntrophosphaera sp.]|jgi:hypothetical protein|nr:hypothetical protein [Candidatus Cloacimonadota bacterium]MDX9948962.1 hypothetical protein [Candidatus Syntrophosphaera sp.]
MMRKTIILATLGNDPHTEGLHKVRRIANKAGLEALVLPPSTGEAQLLETIKSNSPAFLGLSYRLSPSVGVKLFGKILAELKKNGLLNPDMNLGFAGLPATIEAIAPLTKQLKNRVFLFSQTKTALENVELVLDFLRIGGSVGARVFQEMKQELEPPGIDELDEIAAYVVASDYDLEPPLPKPSPRAMESLRIRAEESPFPLIRSHFGIPSQSIQPTLDGMKKLAEAGVLDEISLGSSDLSQRCYGKPLEFERRKNDGGVPYRDKDDLRQLFLASRRGNFPSVKPYAHVTGILDFIDDCLEVGMLRGAHQAIPLYWFNELDGRGETPLEESVLEHLAAVKKLAKLGIPVEMNDPNQWSSRWAHDTVVVADYGLIASVMLEAGVAEMVFQHQFNKPSETGDFADLAKMGAAIEIIEALVENSGRRPFVFRESRTGIEHLSPVPEKARLQLARSTLLQMMIQPRIIHLVSYCEATHAATVEDVIESSKIVRRAVRLFRENEADLKRYWKHEAVLQRKEHLFAEASYLLRRIQQQDATVADSKPRLDPKKLSQPGKIIRAIQKRYMTAPGITHPLYKPERMVTAPGKYGFFDAVCFEDNSRVLSEIERLEMMENETRGSKVT